MGTCKIYGIRGMIGEPKYYVDGKPFTGPWGRPQNDGPALRAMTLSRYALILLKQGRDVSHLYKSELPASTPIKRDLEFVAHHWQDASFDIWEEVRGDHFYTRLVQRRALLRGATLADTLGDLNAANYYRSQAVAIQHSLSTFWDEHRGYIMATKNRNGGLDYKSSELDIQTVLAALHAYDDDLDDPQDSFAPHSEHVLATADKLAKVFKGEYPINVNHAELAPGIGRYPEDRYNGNGISLGNPWVLATLAIAELSYRVAFRLQGQPLSDMNQLTSPFYETAMKESISKNRFFGSLANPQKALIEQLIRQGDRYMERIKFHTGSDLNLREQFNRDTGFMQGATELTWSHVAFETARTARAAVLNIFASSAPAA